MLALQYFGSVLNEIRILDRRPQAKVFDRVATIILSEPSLDHRNLEISIQR